MSMIVSKMCETGLGEEIEFIYDLTGEYVLVREYVRVHDGDPGELDAVARELLDTCKGENDVSDKCASVKSKYRAVAEKLLASAGYGRPFYDQFVVQYMEPWVETPEGKRLPGFDSDTCKFDWRVFACFSYLAAARYKNSVKRSVDVLAPFLEQIGTGENIPEWKWECPSRVMTDPVYDWVAQYTPKASGGGGGTPEPLPPGPGPDPQPPQPGVEPVSVDEDHEGPPWWFWAGAAVFGTWLIWPVAFGKKSRR